MLTDTLAFIVPGLVHRLGNAVFTIQGHAQLLAGDGPAADQRSAILHAAERGGSTLVVLQSLLGHAAAAPQEAGSLLAVLVDILRVPLRDVGIAVECTAAAGADAVAVDGGAFCPAVLEAVRRLVDLLPGGQAGTLELGLAVPTQGGSVVRVGFRADAGSLPFPVAFGDLARGLAALPLAGRAGLRWAARPGGVEIAFPAPGIRQVGAMEA